jgi:hypothetical protein
MTDEFNALVQRWQDEGIEHRLSLLEESLRRDRSGMRDHRLALFLSIRRDFEELRTQHALLLESQTYWRSAAGGKC